MPNWIKGTLKVRGEQENIKRFLSEQLENACIEEHNGWIDVKKTGWSIYLKGSYR